MEPDFVSGDCLSCSVGGGGGRYFSVPNPKAFCS